MIAGLAIVRVTKTARRKIERDPIDAVVKMFWTDFESLEMIFGILLSKVDHAPFATQIPVIGKRLWRWVQDAGWERIHLLLSQSPVNRLLQQTLSLSLPPLGCIDGYLTQQMYWETPYSVAIDVWSV